MLAEIFHSQPHFFNHLFFMNRYTCMKFQGQATAEASSPIWASGEAARGQGEESLQRSLINFHLSFAQTNGIPLAEKRTFQKSNLIDSSPGWHPLNFREKRRNTMLLSLKPV